jgi:outer membrane protein OmpA-like peptidoglycan-associated protein/tetratricopeptide (TPR) repeat protein
MKKIFFLFLLIPFIGFNQYDEAKLRQIIATANEQDLVVENSRMLQEGYIHHANIVVDKLLEMNPESCNYNYRKGYILLDLSSDYIKALPLLEKAVARVDKNFDMYSANEKSAPTDVYFHLARCYHLMENVDKAEEYFSKFLQETLPGSPLISYAKMYQKQLVVARKLIGEPKNYKVKNIGNIVNTKAPEYSPVISLDGSALYFTTRRKWADTVAAASVKPDPRNNFYPEDIYVSYLDFDSTWLEPIMLDFCDPEQNEATIAVSSDERKIYVYQDITGAGDIYYSDFQSNKFNELQAFRAKKVNTKYWETHCTVTPDGLNMYFTSDRPGGFGGRDIYKITKLPDGNWSEPQNLGPTINSKYDEESPFIAIDNKTLYFSSNGENSMGGFDVFLSIRDENNIWSNPINLGYPLNSCNDDLFYTTTVNGLKGYLTSFRKDGFGEKDIYEIQNDFLGLNQLAVFKGKIKTVDNKKFPEDMGITVNCLDCGDALSRKVYPNMRSGLFYSALEPCRQYELIFHHSDGTVEFYKELVSTSCDKKYDEIYREVLLDVDKMEIITYDTTRVVINDVEVKVGEDLGKIINVNPIYFDFDKFDIRPDAAIELDKIIAIMNEYPKLEIELGSHTDCRGKMVYNDWLSQQRATSSANYIKAKITNPERIFGKGYGERKLTNECACEGKSEKKQYAKYTAEQHQANRRTEFVIIKLK